LRKKQKQRIILGIISVSLIAVTISYFYSSDQVKIQGFAFGNNLKSIQDELKSLQIEFISKSTSLKEGDITKEEFLEFADLHLKKIENIVLRYDELSPPPSFAGSVELLKLSTKSQIESFKETIEWIKTDDESAKIRSESFLQEAFEFELAGLAEFNSAKSGINP